MSSISLATTIHICEDTNGTFDVRDLLASAGYTASTTLRINAMSVVMPDGTIATKDTPLFGKVDADTIYVRPGQWAENYNGKFATFEFVLDQGPGVSNNITLSLQVVVDPVNDAPTGADKTFNLSNGNAMVLAQGDFGFVDKVEHDAFKSVIITSLPTAGKLTLNGVALAVGAEVSADDIAAGKLAFEPSQTTSGSFDIGFKVRDAGGLVGCGAADTSATPNYLTFKVPQAHLGDFVWEDLNGNGVQDSGEAGIAGVTVQLKDAGGQVVASTTTDAAGAYHFDVNAGTYSVTVQAPAGYVATQQGQGGNSAADSDINASGSTAPIALAPGETNNKADAGLYRPVSLGDTVWYDSNRNGVQDSGEAGVAGVKVTLLDASGNPVAGATATTDASGHYQFSNLKPGSYSVQFDQTTLPANYLFTAQGQGGNAAKDSDADVSTGKTAQVTLNSGDSTQHLDAGIVIKQATVGDRVWEDSNGNGVQDAGEQGIDGVQVALKDGSGKVVSTVTTHDGGQYSFTVDPGTYSVSVTAPNGYVATGATQGGDSAADSDIDAGGNTGAITLAPGQVKSDIDAGFYRPASLGDKVWLDANRNGVQDAGEAGVAGVKVVLLDASGNPTGITATTDASGNYSFNNLKPGTYSVQFDKATLPANYVFTTASQGAADTGSDADVNTGKSAPVTLNSGDNNHDVDAGIVVVQATVGNRVWEDANGNGVQDAGEQGVDGATVSLKDAGGNVVGTTVTHDGGQYSFTVDPGAYTVSVAPPSGYVFTGAGKGGNGALDSDVSATGDAKVTLASGDVNNDIDAGVYRPASLSQVVWFDANRDGRLNNGETGAAGVKVILLDANGVAVPGAVATTDADGHYQFTNLAPGKYSVQFDKSSLPDGYDFTSAAQGGPGGAGSDADTGTGKTAQVTLASGQDLTLRAGLVVQQATVGDRVWEDSNGNGVQDAGEAGIVGVKVDLKDENGNIVKTTTTGADGKYSFTVDPGKYTVSVTAPAGMSATDQHKGADAVDSDIDASGQSGVITLTAAQVNNNVDAGFYKGATLGDKVWLDANQNGVQDAGETGVAGVGVILLDAAGNPTGATATTDANGNYSFTNLKPGTYSVQFDKTTLPANYLFTGADLGGNDAKDSDANVSTGKTGQVTLTSGQVYTDLDAGIVAAPASLGDKVWLDANRNGVQDAGETGVAGVKVILLDASGNPTGATATTDANGNYNFSNLKPGTYSVQFDKASLPANYVFTTAGQGAADTGSDADVVTGKSGQVTLGAGENNHDIDAGIVIKQATVGNRVWEDSNGNGVQDAGEQGVDGATVSLKDAGGNVVGTVVTHDGGQYSFTVDPGTYTVSVAPPSGYVFTGAGKGGNGALDSDVNASGSAKVTLAPGDVNNDIDAGVYRPASLSQVVWFDADRDGRLDNGETGAAGVKVILLDANGVAVPGAVATTDADGHYQFTNLAPGKYSVQFDKSSLPAGYDFTSAAQGGPGGAGSDADTGTGKTAQVTLASGQDLTLRAGLVIQQATVGDRVWEDSNGNGVQDSGEAGIVGVKVDLKDASGNIVKTTTTGADGKYSFTVDPGKYTVSVTAPAGMTATGQHKGADGVDSDVDANGQSDQITLGAGQTNNNVDAGFYKGATLGDKVWMDANKNGVQDAGETGVADVKVILLDAAGNPTGATATTDANGNYSFTNLKPGAYSVQFDKATLPANYVFTGADLGGNDAKDSDANVSTGKTAQVTLTSGQVYTDLDAGIAAVPAKLGDLVFEDKNGNGVQDAGEAGIGGVTVQLKDSTGKVVQTTTTGTDGKYSFTADPGSYTVSVTAPSGYSFTGKDVGGDDSVDSDFGSNGQSSAITLKAGEINTSVDAGLYKLGSIGDRVWLDANKNGLQDSGETGVCGVKVMLLDADGKQVGATVTTDANGNYQFSNLKPGNYTVVFDKASLPEGMAFTSANVGSNDAIDSDVSAAGVSHVVKLTSGQTDKTVDAGVLAAATIGDRVWIDKNANGIQDDGESGKSGVTVELRDSTGNVVKTTTTDSNGNYKFSVEAGTYSVGIKAPSGFLITAKDQGSSGATDSDADASGNLGAVTVTAGQNVTSLDAGLYQKAEVGDKVWYDTNGDGIQQSGEAAARGVTVTLLNEKGAAVATATTDANGLYSFSDLMPGKYSVKFSAPDGYVFTKQNQGSNDSADSDADGNGVTSQFTLSSGQVDKTRDAGLVKSASIGDRVWEDSNYNGVQDSGEKGVDGVTVKLYDAVSGALKGTTVTHDGGQYLFDDLQAGSYKVEVVNGSGWYFTKGGQGNDASDSDITSISGSSGKTDAITLATGQHLTTEDAGIYRKASIGDKVWRDANHNGIQDSGEEGIGGISVSLFDAVTGKQIGSTIKTDANGNYKFSDLNPGNYYLALDKTDVKVYFASDKATYNMSTWKWGLKNVGSNDAIDSDVIGDAKNLVNTTKTDTITLTSGKNDMSWDASITPIAIDLNGDGIHTIARQDMTGSFDLLGTGKAIQSGWLSKNDGFLAIDKNGNGQIDDIGELFGGASKGSGFAKLASYDSNGDGVVNAKDAQFASLLIWQDANSNGKTDAGELISLGQAGIVSLTVAHTELPFLDANNNLHLERSSVTLSNGKTADMTDVYFNVAASDAAAAGIQAPTIADLMQDSAPATQQVQLVGQCPAVHA
ncbi:protocatechuate 3,4-dioxygenase beta subunit [Duganella sp. 1224]|uniref:SdrD B-like domain-containing protein n=1 Tax=Duganella sp. 1224 TaxID=2587052 RepID=UPI0015C7E41E|nr:SdrD B-like domain-containing protein [Duganella sp. 1224]NYE60388.1 protocatechuate 3,4-dioxygenase beta subunit [Duganella sp. 1224]